MGKAPWDVSRDLVVKVDGETDPSYGCSPERRTIQDHLRYGVINLDKPSGPTSHEVVSWVKRILKVQHAGHGGTLDPKVTGVLPIALEEATKVVGALLLSGKEYICVMRLHDDVAQERVQKVMNEFVGDILQRPPLRSAVKRRTRKRRIYYITDYEFEGRHVLFRVGCQAGTYIRKIVYDVGEALGPGAHMEELRRTRAGPFTEEKDLYTFYELKKAYDLWVERDEEAMLRRVVTPMEDALQMLPKIYVRDSAISSICHGAKLAVPGIAKLETGIKVKEVVGLFSLKGELIALGKATMRSEEMVKNEHGIAATPERVLMALDTYPRMWQSRKAS